MRQADTIRVFDSQGEDYQRAFQVFLDHTDQKRNAKRWLQQVVEGLPARHVFIDAGAGNGEITSALAPAFDRTIAIEPNPYLLSQLQHAIPWAEAIGEPILVANPSGQGDLVLCSHTLYYIPEEQWLVHLEHLVSWMSPRGVTVVVLQNGDTGCMAMLEHFLNLRALADAFRAKHKDRYHVAITLDQAHVDVPDATVAFTVARVHAQSCANEQPAFTSRRGAVSCKAFRDPGGRLPFSGSPGLSPNQCPAVGLRKVI